MARSWDAPPPRGVRTYCFVAFLPVLSFAGVFITQPAFAGSFAANCRYDTPDRVTTVPTVPWANGDVRTVPGTHLRMRLDIDMDQGTVEWSNEGGKWGTWTHGYVWNAKVGRDFVVTDGRFIWFGTDFLDDNGNTTHTAKNRLDLESGLFDDMGGREWECERASNKFQ